MNARKLGRARLAAIAGIALAGMVIATLGHASASRLAVEADGHTVWATAGSATPVTGWPAPCSEGRPIQESAQGTSFLIRKAEGTTDVSGFALEITGEAGTAHIDNVPYGDLASPIVDEWSALRVNLYPQQIKAAFDAMLDNPDAPVMEPGTVYALVATVVGPGGGVLLQTPQFLVGWENESGDNAHISACLLDHWGTWGQPRAR